MAELSCRSHPKGFGPCSYSVYSRLQPRIRSFDDDVAWILGAAEGGQFLNWQWSCPASYNTHSVWFPYLVTVTLYGLLNCYEKANTDQTTDLRWHCVRLLSITAFRLFAARANETRTPCDLMNAWRERFSLMISAERTGETQSHPVSFLFRLHWLMWFVSWRPDCEISHSAFTEYSIFITNARA